ncbi:potassium channel family protein [Clostridium minihomine]|uniref:potassium channel family protein n=1 Tax=Clostridium minihomine TaxID=2045012 RepID=UPI000C75FCEB|nr:TrkA family potassium uptake protein [Clostridium minihomine]
MKVLIVGGGQVGSYLASLLRERGHQITIIEAKDARIEVLNRSLPGEVIMHGNGAEPAVLEAAGVRQADVVAAVTGSDENNLVIGTLARLEYGVHRVVARVNNPKNAWLFTPVMGIDAALNQADLMARLVAEEMSMGDMMTLLKLHGGKYSLVERMVEPNSPIQGKLLKEVKLPTECVLVAVIRNSDLLIPRGETQLMANDKVVAVVHVDQLPNMEHILSSGN